MSAGCTWPGREKYNKDLNSCKAATAACRDSHLPTFFCSGARRSFFAVSAPKCKASTLHVACSLQGLLGLAEDVEDEVPMAQSHPGARGAPKDCLRRLQAPELHLQLCLLVIASAQVTFWARLGHPRHVAQVLGLRLLLGLLLAPEFSEELLQPSLLFFLFLLLRLSQNVLDGPDLLPVPLVDLALDALRIRGVGLGRVFQEQLQLAEAAASAKVEVLEYLLLALLVHLEISGNLRNLQSQRHEASARAYCTTWQRGPAFARTATPTGKTKKAHNKARALFKGSGSTTTSRDMSNLSSRVSTTWRSRLPSSRCYST